MHYNKKEKKKKADIIYGRHPVLEGIENGVNLEKVFLQQGTRGDFEKQLRGLCRQHEIPLQVIPKERMNKWTRQNHQGVIGIIGLIRYYKLEDVLLGIYEKNEAPFIVLLDGVTDVRNFGAIARSAEICGAHAIVVPNKGTAQINSEAMKTSAGALNIIPVCRDTSIVNAIKTLQLSGVQVLASSLDAKKPLHQFDLTNPVALVLGAEGEGISQQVLRAADEVFIIPQKGQTDSFNVSVAGGIMFYEVMKGRMG